MPRPTRGSIRSRCSCRSCSACWAASRWCRWPSARPAPREVAEVLERLWGGDETLVVISSDLSHYLPYAEAQRAGPRHGASASCASTPRSTTTQACGATPLAGALLAARAHGLRAAPARPAQLGRHRRRPRARGGLLRDRLRAARTTPPRRDTTTQATRTTTPRSAPRLLGRARNAIAEALGLPRRPPSRSMPRCTRRAPPSSPCAAAANCAAASARWRPRGRWPRTCAQRAGGRVPRPALRAAAVEEFAEPARSRSRCSSRRSRWPARTEAEALRRAAARRRRRDARMARPPRHLPAAGLGAAARSRASSWPRSSARPGCAADFWADDLRLSRYRVRKFDADARARPA